MKKVKEYTDQEKEEKRQRAADRKIKENERGGWKSSAFKLAAFILVVGFVASIPWFLSTASARLVDHQEYFYYLWAVYAAIQLYVLFVLRKKTMTYNSFTTQNMVWSIFTLGFYVVVDLPKYLPPHLRRVALWLWCSVSMLFNIAFFFIDETDYAEAEAKEARKEERRKKREEKERLADQENLKKQRFSPKTSLMINILLYSTVLLGGAYFIYGYYTEFQQRLMIEKYGYAGPPEPRPDDEL